MDAIDIGGRLAKVGRKKSELARALDLSPDKVIKSLTGVRRFSAQETIRAMAWLDAVEAGDSDPDLPDTDIDRDYIRVNMLPSYGGMGGGGSGEGDKQSGMVPRRLFEDELRAKPSDVMLIEARGDSMSPDFQHGDQILIDKRDVDPRQPGSFALWDGDGYVIKLVERVAQRPGVYRIFSANGRYTAYEVDAENVTIMGRPVWFARRL